MSFVLAAPATTDIAEIAAFVARESPQGARLLATRLGEAFARIGAAPEIGFHRTDLTDRPVRFWRVYSFLIVYRADVRPVQVLRVLHGARDIGAILSREP